MSYDQRARDRNALIAKRKAAKEAELDQAISVELLDYFVTSQQNKCFEICGTKEKFLKEMDDSECMTNCWNSYREAYFLTLGTVSPDLVSEQEIESNE